MTLVAGRREESVDSPRWGSQTGQFIKILILNKKLLFFLNQFFLETSFILFPPAFINASF
jgi:hypothetical protein